MTDDQHDIVAILVKYAMHEPLTSAEERALEQWRQRSDKHDALPSRFLDPEWLALRRRQLHTPPTEEMWADIRRYIEERELSAPVVVVRHRRRGGLVWCPVAALLLVVLVYGGMRAFRGQGLVRVARAGVTVQVGGSLVPAGYKALLRLGNGSFVVLDTVARGAVLAEGGLRKADSNSYVYLVGGGAVSRQRLVLASCAGVTRVQWPDGSNAWVRPGSILEYATDLRSTAIKVEGDVWLKVAHYPAKPVTVAMADDARVRVLGTSFEVRSFAGRAGNRVALFSGRVRVVRRLDSVLLRPGRQVGTGGAALMASSVDSSEALAWLRPAVKSPVFEFQDADLLEMLPEIAAWYQVQVVNPLQLRGKALTGEFFRSTSLPGLIGCLRSCEGAFVRIDLREDTIFISPLKPGK